MMPFVVVFGRDTGWPSRCSAARRFPEDSAPQRTDDASTMPAADNARRRDSERMERSILGTTGRLRGLRDRDHHVAGMPTEAMAIPVRRHIAAVGQ